MDIAKIRKKLRELEAKGGQTDVGSPDTRTDDGVREVAATDRMQAAGTIPEAPPSGEADAGVVQSQESGVQSEDRNRKEEARAELTEQKNRSEEEIVEILTFGLMKEEFAFRVLHLEEILRHQRITKVPRVPKYVLGITSLRGKIIPVIDLRLKLSLTDTPSDYDQKGKILIIKGPKGPIGATVDKVIGVVRIARSEILPPPSHLSETELRFIEGVAIVDKRFVSIINIDETVSLQTKWT